MTKITEVKREETNNRFIFEPTSNFTFKKETAENISAPKSRLFGGRNRLSKTKTINSERKTTYFKFLFIII